MLNFISTAMVTTTRRFVNVEMGKPDGNINKVFNICLLLHIGFALLILIIAETVGIWYINNMLNVAPGKEVDAMFVFQISTIVACIGKLAASLLRHRKLEGLGRRRGSLRHRFCRNRIRNLVDRNLKGLLACLIGAGLRSLGGAGYRPCEILRNDHFPRKHVIRYLIIAEFH